MFKNVSNLFRMSSCEDVNVSPLYQPKCRPLPAIISTLGVETLMGPHSFYSSHNKKTENWSPIIVRLSRDPFVT